MRDVFAAMPDSVLPMVTKNNRLDCIDFIENQMEARVRNKVDAYVTLEVLTSDYARFRTSETSVQELKLLPTSDSTAVLCEVTTVQVGEQGSDRQLKDSNIRLLQVDWTPLSDHGGLSEVLRQRDGEAYLQTENIPDSLLADVESARASLAAFHPVEMRLAADAPTLTLVWQTGYLTPKERAAMQERMQPLVMQWTGSRFEVFKQ